MLRKWMLSFGLFLAVLGANAQFRKIPAVVTDAFKAKFANASSVEWKDKIVSFEADFKVGEKDVKAFFTSKGEWIKTESKFSYNSLPVAVKDGFKKSKFADHTVADVSEIDDKDKGLQYKLVVKNNEYTKRNLVFTKDGQLTSDNTTL